MSDFNAFLTRSFAEAEHPADDGFSLRVGAAVARRERAARARSALQTAGLGLGIAVVGYAGLNALFGAGQELISTGGLEATRVVGAFDEQAPLVAAQAQEAGIGFVQSLGLGLTQILVIAAALLGGAVAYRSAQD
ncbi:MAG TPA: hypothetical protein DHW63_04585 [Hyphomonadaceae bacterium]|nr:hypothetical protein [Hyphomonadaceae bacterium]